MSFYFEKCLFTLKDFDNKDIRESYLRIIADNITAINEPVEECSNNAPTCIGVHRAPLGSEYEDTHNRVVVQDKQ